MTKRPSSPNAAPPPKRSRKPAGFRVARPRPTDSQQSSSNPSLFITVSQPDERRVTLRAQTRVLSSTPDTSTSTSSTSTNDPEPEVEQSNDSANSGADTVPTTETTEPELVKPKRKRRTKNAHHLHEWLEFRSTFLDEVLRHDRLGDFLDHTKCSTCQQGLGIIRCRDCASGRMLKCPECIVAAHETLPLHRVERWNGQFFDNDSLHNLGLSYQVGHSGGACPCPLAGPKNFVVFDTTSFHRVSIKYCNCGERPPSNWTQLLRERWFPATLSRPQTVFTFDCLETFHELTLQGKANLYDYYNTLLQRSDNADIYNSINRYSEIHRVFRMWRNLMALKRAGRGHEPGGINATSKGELTVECPACPHPGRNLPDGWEKSGALLFLYTLFLAVDGNFKLKGKERRINDIELMPGWGAYVPETEYQSHIANYVDQTEINTCESQHDALVRAATRSSPGYAVSGAMVVVCSRHCMVRRNGAGDLQLGEKYCNADFVVFAAIIGIMLLRIVLTYDIACQWSKNFRKCMEQLPPDMQIPDTTKLDVAIPGWHINGHGETCRTNFNLSYMEGTGRTVGEDVETIWAGTNPLAPSIREMGPAARHDTLNDHWNGWNFRKIVGFRTLLLRRFNEAADMSIKQAETFDQLSATFSLETIAKWEAMLENWNADPKAPNPYREPKSQTTLQDVRLQLAREEAAQVAIGDLPQRDLPRHETSLLTFLMIGFELEDSQYLLRCEVAETKGLRSSKQLADLQEKRTALLRRIQNWREVQLVYIPHVASLLSRMEPPPEINANTATSSSASSPENVPLFMPSSLPDQIRTLPALHEICQLEQRLREPQADDALADIRRQRRVIQGLWQFKKLNVSGTGNRPNTRFITLYKRFDHKTKRFAQRYRTAQQALHVLDPNGSWSTRLKELKDVDIRGPGKDLDDKSNSRYEPSWIWLVPRVTEPNNIEAGMREEELNDCMRVEWVKSKAHMMRWKEELLLVQEEMRRVLVYQKWKAAWWRTRSALRTHDDGTILSGVSGYAHKQAAICERMATRCAHYWLPRLKDKGITPPWASEYVDSTSPVVQLSEEVDVGGGTLGIEGDLDIDLDEVEQDDEGGDDVDEITIG